jgi:hypothetical protein
VRLPIWIGKAFWVVGGVELDQELPGRRRHKLAAKDLGEPIRVPDDVTEPVHFGVIEFISQAIAVSSRVVVEDEGLVALPLDHCEH